VTHTDISDREDTPAREPVRASKGDSEPTSLKSAAWELIQTVALAIVLFLLIRNVVQNFRIDGISMEPNLHNGQFLIVNRFAYCPGLHLDINPLNIHLEKTWCVRQPKRGDVIVFEYPKDLSRDFIKRVIGMPGDTVEVRGGKVFINGEQMPEPFGPNPGSSTDGPITVGSNEVFVMGDNRNNSSDSRTWGSLPLEFVIGKAVLSYWPPRYWAVVPRYDLTGLSASTP
jgi:signal peptidase I